MQNMVATENGGDVGIGVKLYPRMLFPLRAKLSGAVYCYRFCL